MSLHMKAWPSTSLRQLCGSGAPWPSGHGYVPHSPAPTWNHSVNVLLFLDREKNLMPPGEVDGLELGEDSLDEERKIPLKLTRRGERGGDSW